jgi:hypothetical protein
MKKDDARKHRLRSLGLVWHVVADLNLHVALIRQLVIQRISITCRRKRCTYVEILPNESMPSVDKQRLPKLVIGIASPAAKNHQQGRVALPTCITCLVG